jgi:hypothetical protein
MRLPLNAPEAIAQQIWARVNGWNRQGGVQKRQSQ